MNERHQLIIQKICQEVESKPADEQRFAVPLPPVNWEDIEEETTKALREKGFEVDAVVGYIWEPPLCMIVKRITSSDEIEDENPP